MPGPLIDTPLEPADLDELADWLQNHTRDVSSETFWTDLGGEAAEYALQPAEVVSILAPAQGSRRVLEMRAIYLNRASPMQPGRRPGVPFVRFDLERLAAGRVNLRLDVHDSSALAYILPKLLPTMAEKWPQLRGKYPWIADRPGGDTDRLGGVVAPGGAIGWQAQAQVQPGSPVSATAPETPKVKPACARWRKAVEGYLATVPADEEPTEQGLADAMIISHETVRKRASKHRRCCFDWLDVKHSRRLPA